MMTENLNAYYNENCNDPCTYNKSRLERYRIHQKYGTHKILKSKGPTIYFDLKKKLQIKKTKCGIPKESIFIDGYLTTTKAKKIVVNPGNRTRGISIWGKCFARSRFYSYYDSKENYSHPDYPQIRLVNKNEISSLIVFDSIEYKHKIKYVKKQRKNAIMQARQRKLDNDIC